MDYTYYQNPSQAYQFLGLPTPGHSASGVSSEDFNHSPTVGAPSFHYVPPVHLVQPHLAHTPQSEELFLPDPSPQHYSHARAHSSFSHYSPHPHTPAPHYPPSHHSSSPVSPVQHSSPSFFSSHSPLQPATPSQTAYLTPRGQDGFDQFQNFEYNQHYTSANPAAALPKSASPIPQQQHRQSISNGGNGMNGFDINKFESNGLAGLDTTPAFDATQDEARRSAGQNQSNSDDDDMTPAQSRRKAQNRAAQRAFRERKERHVKDLEAKLLALENQSKNLSSENERLKVQLQKASTENEILKATSTTTARPISPPTTAGPLQYSPTDFYSEVLQSHENKTPSHRIVFSEGGERLLAAGAAWDYIIAHPLFLRGLVDVGDVSERLKTLARCDGQGPVFEESAILKAIELSVASGSDELM